MSEKVAIVGVGMTNCARRLPDVSQPELVNKAAKAALENAQLQIKDIDVVLTTTASFIEGTFLSDQWLVEGNGGYLKSGMKTNSAGTTGHTIFTSAWSHIASGLFETALVVATTRMDEPAVGGQGIRSMDPFFDVEGGVAAALLGVWAVADNLVSRGAASEELAARIRVKESQLGALNENAHLREIYTVEQIMASDLLVHPLRFLHICPTSAGACALVLTEESRAKKITTKPVWVRDFVTIHGGMSPRMGTNLFLGLGTADVYGPMWGWSTEKAAVELYKRNGITNPRKQIDVIETYSPSVWHEMLHYESLHLCEKGEQEKFFNSGATLLDGEIPVDPSGGVPCTNPVCATGMIRICEIARQLRGEAGQHQIAKPNPKIGMSNAIGADRYSILALFSTSLD
jgi:acetyl-CoA C-acetyltransferase